MIYVIVPHREFNTVRPGFFHDNVGESNGARG